MLCFSSPISFPQTQQLSPHRSSAFLLPPGSRLLSRLTSLSSLLSLYSSLSLLSGSRSQLRNTSGWLLPFSLFLSYRPASSSSRRPIPSSLMFLARIPLGPFLLDGPSFSQPHLRFILIGADIPSPPLSFRELLLLLPPPRDLIMRRTEPSPAALPNSSQTNPALSYPVSR